MPKNPSEQEILESQLKAEYEKWGVLGLQPSNWAPGDGMLGIVLRLDVLTEILVEAGIIDMDNANERMARKALQRLQEIRKELEPQIAQAKLDAIRNGNLGGPRI